MKETVLFVTHKPKQCGVYEFGRNVFNAIASSSQYNFIKGEYESINELTNAIKKFNPTVIVFNYHPTVMPWVCSKLIKGLYKNHTAELKPTTIGIIHEVTQNIADTATGYRNQFIIGSSKKKINSLFDYYITADPTLLLKNPIVFKTGRIIPEYNKKAPESKELVIGSFGFATPKKGFEKIIKKVQEEFDEATIRFNIPTADFGDETGFNARKIASNCQALIQKPGIKLNVTHDYLNHDQLLDFLAGNTINVFLYEDLQGRGISSAADMALAVKKPLAVSNSPMFRHILSAAPTISADEFKFIDILNNGFLPLKKIHDDWNKTNMQWEFERILNRIISASDQSGPSIIPLQKKVGNFIRKSLTLPDKKFSWLRNTTSATEDDISRVITNYSPVQLNSNIQFNRILDDNARKLYAPAIKKLKELVPKTMSKKIERANVQQAFIFDTVYRLSPKYINPNILCVGSYEDTASMALIKMGFEVEEIDPMINYYLQEFYTKPSTAKNYYQIIFSTSVIEHDPNDESFIKCISGLLAPGGIAVLTCDYKDGWRPGQPKPEVDARFYTKYDLEQRLLSYIPDCELVDLPDWHCPNPDFNYLGKYQYTFATFCIRKKFMQ
jgi:hypothetical protein